MSYQEYSLYHVTLSSGNDPGGAQNLCSAIEKEFAGIDANLDGNVNEQPSGLIIFIDGGNAKTRETIRAWIESKREKYC